MWPARRTHGSPSLYFECAVLVLSLISFASFTAQHTERGRTNINTVFFLIEIMSQIKCWAELWDLHGTQSNVTKYFELISFDLAVLCFLFVLFLIVTFTANGFYLFHVFSHSIDLFDMKQKETIYWLLFVFVRDMKHEGIEREGEGNISKLNETFHLFLNSSIK